MPSTISPGAASPLAANPSAPPPGDRRASFEACICEAGGTGAPGSPASGQPAGEAAAGTPSEAPADGGAMDEAAFQKQMFERLTEGLDPDVQKRLSKWLPDVLDGGKKDLKKAVKDIGKQDAKDLDDLAEALDLKHDFKKVKDRDGFGQIIEKAEHKANRSGLEQIKRAYGEQALKASTPELAPSVSYDTGSTLDASRQAVYEKFVSGVSEAKREQLHDWLPDVLFDEKSAKKAAKKLNDKEEDALRALAKEHEIDLPSIFKGDTKDRALLNKLETAFKRDLALETTAELPSVVDMMLVAKVGEDNGDTAAHLHLKDDDILKVAKKIKKEFSDLDDWLPAVLAGRAEMPADDKDAKKLLIDFAEEMGFDPKKGDDLGERAEKALAYIEKQDVFGKALHPGKEGENSAFLLFTDRFLESTLAYGAKHETINQPMLADAAQVAEMLLGPDDGTDKPRDLEMAGLQAAILHRTNERLARPQEVMAASGYINSAETLTEQKTRLVESLLAFHVREKIGTPPMSPLQWARTYADLHPEMLDDLGNLAFNAPAGDKMQIITQHLGVPGEHEFGIDKRRTIKIENDKDGNLEHFDRDKIKKPGPFEKFMNIAVPVIGTVLTFVPGAQAIGMGINMAYGAYQGAQAIKHGDLEGGLLNIATSLTGARVFQVASGALQTMRAIESKDWMSALAGGLGTVAAGGGGQRFQTAATGIHTAQSLKEGDFLQAGAGVAGLAGDAAGYNNAASGNQYALQGLKQGLSLADGIQEKNYAGIGQAASGLIQVGGNYQQYQQEQAKLPPELGVGGGGPPTDGGQDIRQAGYHQPSVEVAGGDTLSQIAARHGTTVEALMAANPGIGDPNRIHAGQQLALPIGVQPVGNGQQQRLQEFADSQGGPSHLPSPPRPGQGDPMQQPGATHPNADPHAPIHAQPGATHPNAGDQQMPGAQDGDVHLTELMEGAGRELATLPGDARETLSAAVDIAQAAADGLGALAHGVASSEHQTSLQDEYDRTQQRLSQLDAAIDHLVEAAPDLPQYTQKWLADTAQGLKQEVQTLGHHIDSGNGVEVGATLMGGALAVAGIVKNAAQGVAEVLRPLGPVDRPGGEGMNPVETPDVTPNTTDRPKEIESPDSKSHQPLEIKGKYSNREFDPDNAGGPILDLDYRSVEVNLEGIENITTHTGRFDSFRPNEIMLERLRKIANGEMEMTDYDQRFYTHELRELERYRNLGIPDHADPSHEVWNNAHTATLEDFKIYELDENKNKTLYHPDTWEHFE